MNPKEHPREQIIEIEPITITEIEATLGREDEIRVMAKAAMNKKRGRKRVTK